VILLSSNPNYCERSVLSREPEIFVRFRIMIL
jgi:hypothetical protein